MARLIDADELMTLLKEQYHHHVSTGNKQIAKAWQGTMQLLYDMPTFSLPNEPLTLEQLQEMDRKPVWIHTFSSKSKKTNIEEWALVASSSEYSVSFVRVAVSGRMDKRCSDYGKTWLCYPYPLPHIDREAWEPCEHCKPAEYPPDYYGPHNFPIVGNEIYYYDTEDGWEGEEISICPWCGRPLTKEAWAELEKRLRR